MQITDNKHVKELLSIMKNNTVPSLKELVSILNQMNALELQLASMEKDLKAVKQELAEAKNHPLKSILQGTVKTLENNVVSLKNKLDELKQTFIVGCKNAVTSFKENGISALNNIMKFFKVKPILESMRKSVSNSIKADEKTIEKLQSVSTEYHKAGRHLQNMIRVSNGKEPVQAIKPNGKLANALMAHLSTRKSYQQNLNRIINAAIGNLNKLEKNATIGKPSIKSEIQNLNKKIVRVKKVTQHRQRSDMSSRDH